MLLNIFSQTTIVKAIQNFLISSQKAKFIDVPARCMTSGVFRGKESSSRIKLSQLVQDLLNFCDLGSLQLLGVGGWVDGGGGGWMVVGWGVPHTCAHACTCMHGKHDNFMQMAASIGFLGNPCGNSL